MRQFRRFFVDQNLWKQQKVIKVILFSFEYFIINFSKI
jgi:hypothetical protein